MGRGYGWLRKELEERKKGVEEGPSNEGEKGVAKGGGGRGRGKGQKEM